MRCKYCGSTSIHAATEHRNFSAGKAVAGAVTFGVVGVAVGFIGKEQKGYKCASCGAFMDAPMGIGTESGIDNAIRDAEAGRSRHMFDYFKKQYPNIEANIPQPTSAEQKPITRYIDAPKVSNTAETVSKVKRSYRSTVWLPDCPIFVESIIIAADDKGDTLSLVAWNQGSKNIRSAYFKSVVYDDTGDEVATCQCVYQGMSIKPSEKLDVSKTFSLNTDLAYRVDLVCEKVALEDDTVWRLSDNAKEVTLSAQPIIDEENFPKFKYVKQHLKDACSLSAEKNTLYLPVKEDTHWQCICGHPVRLDCVCPRCGAKHEKLESLLSQEYLSKLQQDHVKSVAAKRAKETMALYDQAKNQSIEGTYKNAVKLKAKDNEASLTKAAELFSSISHWKDSAKLAEDCLNRIPVLQEELRVKKLAEEKAAEEARKKAEIERKEKERKAKAAKKAMAIWAIAAVVIAAGVLIYINVIAPMMAYNNAVELMNAEKYKEAITAFNAMEGYKDSALQVFECKYRIAIIHMNNKNYKKAITDFNALDGYKDSTKQIENCETAIKDIQYNNAIELVNNQNYEKAIKIFNEIKDYKDSYSRMQECKYSYAVELINKEDFNTARSLLNEIKQYKDSIELIEACEIAIKDIKYNNAVALMNSGKYIKSYEDFISLRDYKDSAEKAKSIFEKYKMEKLKTAKKGDYVYFGKYEQDNNNANGKEPIEWKVIKEHKNRILVMSKYALDCKPFNNSYDTYITWDECTLRSWLNSTFINNAFSGNEKALIPTVEVHADSIGIYSGGYGTKNKVFLLATYELSGDLECKPTKYAIANGVSTDKSNGNCNWWLRASGKDERHTAIVNVNGSYGGRYDGMSFWEKNVAVRPAMWIDLGAL